MSRFKEVCIDYVDPWSLSHWWAEATVMTDPEGNEFCVFAP
jgi:hypothetical protein